MQIPIAEQMDEAVQKATVPVSEIIPTGVMPTIDTGTVNPLENAQGANPYDKTNPFSDMKTNPFE